MKVTQMGKWSLRSTFSSLGYDKEFVSQEPQRNCFQTSLRLATSPVYIRKQLNWKRAFSFGQIKGLFFRFWCVFHTCCTCALEQVWKCISASSRQSFKTFNSHVCCCDCCQVFGFLSAKQSIKSSFLASQGSGSFILHLMSFLLVNTISGTRVNAWECVSDFFAMDNSEYLKHFRCIKYSLTCCNTVFLTKEKSATQRCFTSVKISMTSKW